MPLLDEIKYHPRLLGNEKWPTELAENETVKKPTAEDTTDANGLPCYQMKSKHYQGIGVIINNKTFTSMNNRNGTDKDALALERLFTYLGFYTNHYSNLTESEIVHTLKDVAFIDYKSHNCLMIAILTHGVDRKYPKYLKYQRIQIQNLKVTDAPTDLQQKWNDILTSCSKQLMLTLIKFHQGQVQQHEHLAETIINDTTHMIILEYITIVPDVAQLIESKINDLLCEMSLLDQKLRKCPSPSAANRKPPKN